MEKAPRLRLARLKLAGYRSIARSGQDISFNDDITILVGPNGAGKSNLVSFFRMLNYMMTGALRLYVPGQGFSRSLLYYGPEVTGQIAAELLFSGQDEEKATENQNYYRFNLAHAAGDTLVFTNEEVEFRRLYGASGGDAFPSNPQILGVGHQESLLREAGLDGLKSASILHSLLQSCRVYQFHNTAGTAKIRGQGYIDDNRYLCDDAGNLAAFLFAMQNDSTTRKYYDRIVRYIQQVVPQFDDFALEPSRGNDKYIRLDWRDRNRPTYLFGPHQLSDGTLRFMALTALLLQPPASLPNTIIIDEPELGLHPAAMTVLGAMARIAARHSQVILSTQSPRLVDEFEAPNVTVVEWNAVQGSTEFRTLDLVALGEWLQEYSLSDLWEKNVLGGLP